MKMLMLKAATVIMVAIGTSMFLDMNSQSEAHPLDIQCSACYCNVAPAAAECGNTGDCSTFCLEVSNSRCGEQCGGNDYNFTVTEECKFGSSTYYCSCDVDCGGVDHHTAFDSDCDLDEDDWTNCPG